MRRLLLIDTCGRLGTVALAEANEDGSAEVLASEVLPGRTASERLVAVVGQMLKAKGWRLCELAAIVVARGPGSFTGVRVGLAAAKGWSEASSAPLIAVSRLEVLAGAGGYFAAPVWAVLDAGRGEVYAGEYLNGVCSREVLTTPEELRAESEGHEMVVCEANVFSRLDGLSPVLVEETGAVDLLGIAVKRLAPGAFDDVVLLDANYLRRMEQEIAVRLAAQGR